jgi:hypothetical protein
MNRPLLRGFVLADAELLGKLARSGGARENRHQLMSHRYFELLAEHRLPRADLNPEDAAWAFLATLEGFLQAAASSGEPAPADLQRCADLLASRWRYHAVFTGSPLHPATRPARSRR